jgi:outer membrane lipoprotein LolB
MRPAVLILLIALGGCATTPPAIQPVDWTARRAALWALDDWRMTGRVAVTVAGEGGSASIDWRQSGQVSDLAVSGPLGVGSLRAVLDPAGLRLEDGSGARLADGEAERALARRLGAEVPVGSLRYWVLGTPAPGVPAEETVDAAGRASSFRQAGWQVDLGRFESTPGGELPTRLTLERDGARLKLAVSRWEVRP